MKDSNIPFMRRGPGVVNIVKLYGDLDQPDTIMLARQQYEAYFLQRPQMVKLLEMELVRSDTLYLGWSGSDPYFKLVFGGLLSRFGQMMRPGYAVMFDVTDDQRDELRRKQIRLVDLPAGDRTAQLAGWVESLAPTPAAGSRLPEARKGDVTLPAPLEPGMRPGNRGQDRGGVPESMIRAFFGLLLGISAVLLYAWTQRQSPLESFSPVVIAAVVALTILGGFVGARLDKVAETIPKPESWFKSQVLYWILTGLVIAIVALTGLVTVLVGRYRTRPSTTYFVVDATAAVSSTFDDVR